MLPASATVGQCVFLAVSCVSATTALPQVVYDNQGNQYSLLTSNTSGTPYVALYGGVIKYNTSSYPGPYIEPQVSFNQVGTGISLCAFVANLDLPGSSSIQAIDATPATATGTAASVGTITFTPGNGVDIGVYGWIGATAGGIVPAAGYSTAAFIEWYSSASAYPGLAVIYQNGDTTGSATPSLTFTNPVTWRGIGTVLLNPAAIVVGTLDTPSSIPAIALNATNNLTVTGINTSWTAGSSPLTAVGATINSQTVNAATQTITASVTAAATTGTITLSDSTTGCNVQVGTPDPLLLFATGNAGIFRTSNYIYYSTSGNDTTGTGTQANPYATPAKAASVASALDVCIANSGDTFTGISATVSSTNYLFWTSSSTTPASLTAAANTIPTILQGNNTGIYVSNMIFNANLTTAMSGNRQSVIESYITDSLTHNEGMYVYGCSISNGMIGIATRGTGSNTPSIRSMIVMDNTINAMIDGGIKPGNTFSQSNTQTLDTSILSNTITNCSGYAYSGYATGTGIIFTSSYVLVGICRVINNYIYNIGYSAATATAGPAGIIINICRGLYVSGNMIREVYQGTTGANGECIRMQQAATRNTTIDYNVAANSDGAFVSTSSNLSSSYNNIVRFNLAVGVNRLGQQGVVSLASTSSAQFTIYNNSFFNAFIGQGIVTASSLPIHIFNNIIISTFNTYSTYINRTAITGDKIDGNWNESSAGVFNCNLGGTVISSLASWKSNLSLYSMGGAGEVGPSSTAGLANVGSPDGRWTSTANIPSEANTFSAAIGSIGANAAVNIVSIYGNSCGIAAMPPIDLAGNAIPSPYSIGASTVAANYIYANQYDSAILNISAYARYTLGELSGITCYESLWSRYLATYANSPTIGAPSIIPGTNRTATTFNGTNQRAYYVAPFTPTTASISISVWFKFSSLSGTAYIAGTNNGANTGASISINTSSQIQFTVIDSSTGTPYTATATGTTLAPNTLYHVACTWSASGGFAIYIDSTLQTIATSGTNPSLVYYLGLSVASDYSGSTFGFAGTIQDIVIYLTVISQSNVNSIYNIGINASYTLTGPSTVVAGNAASYTITPSTTIASDTIGLSDGGAGGTFNPASVVFNSSSAPQGFLYTNNTPGNYTLTLTSNHGIPIGGSPAAIAVTTPPLSYTFAGPSSGYAGSDIVYTLTPNEAATDTIYLTDGDGGAFSPNPVVFSGSTSPRLFSYNNATGGTYVITPQSTGGHAISPPAILLNLSPSPTPTPTSTSIFILRRRSNSGIES